MTLRDFMERVRGSGTVFGNADHFGVAATLTPAGGGSARAITVHFRYDAEYEPGPYVEQQVELAWVEVARDPACDRGGIDSPRIGDELLRATDAPDRPWSFRGGIRNTKAGGWELLFGRRRPEVYKG